MCVVGALPGLLDNVLGKDAGGATQTGISAGALVQQSFEILQEGLPAHAVSRSAKTKIRAYCRACGESGLQRHAEVSAVQTCHRSDGSAFVAFHMLSMFQEAGRPCVLGAPWSDKLPSCPAWTDIARLTELQEEALGSLKKARAALNLPSESCPAEIDELDEVGFRFYHARLQEQCMLFDGASSAARREPEVLPRGAQVFSDRPVRKDALGLRFALRVDEASEAFSGLPWLGFTRRAPVDSPDLYPAVSSNLAQSVLVGGSGEASARDEAKHFKSGFRAPPQSEVETFRLQPDVPQHQRQPPALPVKGSCRMQIRAHQNLDLKRALAARALSVQGVLLDFDIRRPLDPDADYYATLDVSFSLHRATLVPVSALPEPQVKPLPSEQLVHHSSLASLSLATGSTICGDDDSSSSEAHEFRPEQSLPKLLGSKVEHGQGLPSGDWRSSLLGGTVAAVGVLTLVLVSSRVQHRSKLA
ncbi:hypothetical protein AK812_SmicGene41066 [Symbiodinium microadriaticum]|uniref:Uncharacterized protein n=1 Tax=Symbiodinium microadriaticum TaxID=2951 RepID=A0A1Q9C776_SYMMI|nr:hypothetical protein AK812_SmicGene41066 [Symbiodinium microadriaticum]